MSFAAKAIAFMVDAHQHGRPIPSTADLAKIVGCHRGTLYRSPQYKAARKASEQV
jgi:hypothetical protein